MFLDISIKVVRRIIKPSFFVLLLMAGVVVSVAYGLSEIIAGLTTSPLMIIGLTSLVLGYLIARSNIKGWFAALFLLVVGIFGTYFWVGKLLTPFMNFIRALNYWIWGYLREQQEIIKDFAPLQLASTELSLAFNTILVDLLDWGRSLSSNNPVSPITIIFFFWSISIWIVFAWAGWVQKRYGNVILSIFPASLLLVSMMGYTWAEISPLIPLLSCILLLLALTWLNKNENRWVQTGIDYPVDVRFDSLLSSVIISIFIIALAFFLPRISIRKMVETVRELTKPQVQQAQPIMESLGIQVERPGVGRFGPLLSGGLPRSHLIGGGPELTEQIVMTVKITDGLPPDGNVNGLIPLYWRGLTYDRYTGKGWNSSEIKLRTYAPDESAIGSDRPGYWIVEQDFKFTNENKLLFTAGDLINSDERYRIAWRSEPSLSDEKPFRGDFFGAAIDEISYRANSFIPVVDEESLRNSSRDYPDWIRDNYLSVPVETSQRVVQQSMSIIQGKTNPYDQAKAIESYLRQFEYTTDLPKPPEDRDIVDYFLFVLKKGYCDYFATSMVVMARTAGLPARLAIGYATGSYDSANARFVVTEAEAHSWPEIYFEGFGWVPFEPTSGRLEISLPKIPLEYPEEAVYFIETDNLSGGIKPLFGSWLLTIGIFLILIIWIWMIWITIDEWLLKKHEPEMTTTRIYWRLYKHGKWLGVTPLKDSTPSEFAKSLQDKVISLPLSSVGRKPMDQVSSGIERLTLLFIQAQYSSKALEIGDRENIMSIWQRLRRQLLIARGLFMIRKILLKIKITSV